MEGTQDTFLFSQYAQDPLEEFLLEEEEESALVKKLKSGIQKKNKERRSKRNLSNKVFKRSGHDRLSSFIINNKAEKGTRLLKIQIFDLNKDSDDEDNVVLSAQYLVDDNYDEVIDHAESVIHKISKKLSGYSATL